MADWTRISFLESSSNLRRAVSQRMQRATSAELAREASICIQQGRLFYQSALSSALEIKPLVLFYGTLAFSRAIVIAHQGNSIDEMAAAHGLKSKMRTSTISSLSATVQSSGTFVEFNNVVNRWYHFTTHAELGMSVRNPLTTAESSQIIGFEMTLKDVLARIAGLEGEFNRTFQTASCAESVYLCRTTGDQWIAEFSETTQQQLSREGIERWVQTLRSRFPLLQNARVVQVERSYDKWSLQFSSETAPEQEFEERHFTRKGSDPDHFFAASVSRNTPPEYQSLGEVLKEHGGGLCYPGYCISPHNGQYLSPASWEYIGIFILSNLVRYRPQMWVNAIRRSVIDNAPADDRALALIEAFLSRHVSTFSSFVADFFLG